jgi:hypothetical protein
MMNKQNISENEVFKPDRARPKIISKYTEDLVLAQDPFSFRQLKYINNLHYYGPFEPDGVHLKYWCRFNHIASSLRDHSFSKNNTIPVGKPQLCKGPSDGVKGGTIVTRINTSGDSIDYFYTPDDPSLQIATMDDSFSIYLSFMMEGIGNAGVGQVINSGIKPAGFKTPGIKVTGSVSALTEDAMIRMKIDDNIADNGYMIKVGTTGELKFFVRRDGTTRNFISPPNKITMGLFTTACLTYDMGDNSMVMRINNEPQSDVANETPIFPSGHSLSMFHGIGPLQDRERMRGRFQDSRTYNNYKFTNTEMDNIWNNKRSISPILYGHLSVAGVAHFNTNVYTAGYDATAFDATGYETI